MSTIRMLGFLLLCTAAGLGQTPSTPVPPAFFGMTVNHGNYPSVPYDGLSIWDTGHSWFDLEPSRETYYFAGLDAFISNANNQGITADELVYTFGHTPSWAGTYFCGAPQNEQDWNDFVTTLVTHVAGKIKYWVTWNEPNVSTFYCGTMAQLVTMASDAYRIIKSIDPNAVVLTPAATSYPANWLSSYFAAGGAPYADMIAFHGYTNQTPESIVADVDAVYSVMNTYGLGDKPLWDTEGSWGQSKKFPDQDQQANFLARSYLLHWSKGVPRFYWYAWDNDQGWGTLWSAKTGILKPGIAYGELYNWMVGATMSTPCSMTSNSTWTCGFTRSGGYSALAIWNANGALSYTPPSEYTQYRDIYGNKYPLGNSLTIGPSPLLLETADANDTPPPVTLTPSSLSFANQLINTSSTAQPVALHNNQSVALNISSIAVSSGFSETDNCGPLPNQLPAGGSCTISVVFTPTAVGTVTGTLSVTDDAANSPQVVTLSGTGVSSSLAAPSSLTASATSASQIDLTWTNNDSNQIGVQIERSPDNVSFTQIASVAANATTYSDTGLAAATTYYYRVRAFDSSTTSPYSNTASATTQAAVTLAAPSNLTASTVSQTQINLAWKNNASDQSGVFIEQSPNGGSFAQIAVVGANVTTYSVAGLTRNTMYFFRVRAFNSAATSAYSNVAKTKTLR